MLVVVLTGGGFSCRAQVLENDLFYFENPQSVYTTVSGLLTASQAKYSMVVGKKNNSIPMVDYIIDYCPFKLRFKEEERDSPIINYYFEHRSKVYIVAWRGKERRADLVDKIYKEHRTTLRSKTNLRMNGEVLIQAGDVEIEEKVTFMGDTEALHRTLIMKMSQSILTLLVPPMDFYYDLYQYYDKQADITVVALFYRVEINPDMRGRFPGEFSDTMRPDFEKHFKLKRNAPAAKGDIQALTPPELDFPVGKDSLSDELSQGDDKAEKDTLRGKPLNGTPYKPGQPNPPTLSNPPTASNPPGQTGTPMGQTGQPKSIQPENEKTKEPGQPEQPDDFNVPVDTLNRITVIENYSGSGGKRKPAEKAGGEKETGVSPVPSAPEDVPPLALKRSSHTTTSLPVSGREVLQFAEDARSVYILYKRGPLLSVGKEDGKKHEVVSGYDAMDISGVAVDRKGRLLLYTGQGLLRWDGKSLRSSPVIFKYDGYMGRNSKVTVTPTGDLLVYGGSSSPTVLLSAEGKLLAASDKLKGEQALMMPDGKIWARSTYKIVSGDFSGEPVEYSYESKWGGNSLSGVRDMCARGSDLLVCGNSLLVYRNGQWKPLYEPKGTYFSCMAVDKQGVIWLVAGEGVMCMGKDANAPLKTLDSIQTPQGKKNLGYTKAIYIDASDNLWIVTPDDVIVHNPKGLMGLLPSTP